METLEIKVENVKCGGCVANITANLREIDGIENIEVDIATGLVTIIGHPLDNDQIKEKLIALGYPPSTHG